MGEVYRATNVSLGRKVAIKLLSPEYVHIEEDVLRFLREARAAAAVRHTNVVDVIDVARDDDGTPFIVQELLAGEDLEHYLRSRHGRLSCEEALEIMIPVADAVAAAHAQDVVHRDLKPANIFLARDRNRITPKVLDFGACLFPTIAERSAKEARMLIGTPHYMAPEQIVSKQDVDTRSDVWALGVILYEMMVGETPFEAETTNAVLQLVKTRDVPPLRERVREAPAELDALVGRCTKRDRLARFRDAGALHKDMLAVRERMRGTPVSSRMPTLMELPAEQEPEPASRREPEIPSLRQYGSDAKSNPKPSRGGLLTLSSPGSEPPSPLDDLDISTPTIDEPGGGRVPPASAQRRISVPPPASRPRLDPSGVRELEADPPGSAPSLDLAARPSSWPPALKRTSDGTRTSEPSSLPPVLDPRGLGGLPSSIPPLPVPRDAIHEERAPMSESAARPTSSPKPRPPAVLAKDTSSRSTQRRGWSSAETAKFVAVVALPAILCFVVVLAIPALGNPVGRALRGDSMVASGTMAVAVLVAAAGLCARSMLGERSRWLYVASAGGVLFGIVMIIVTFAASEATELGVPQSMAGLSTLVAPIAPLALGLGALAKARAAWTDPYSRREAVRFAALASLMLFLTLALSPVGVVRTPSRTPQPSRGILGG
jgi:serine/threonine-protein kinase